MKRFVVIALVMGLIGVVVVFGIGALVLDAFNDSCANQASGGNATFQNACAPAAETTINNGLTMLGNFTGQLGTVGTIAGVLILVLIVAVSGLALFGVTSRGGGGGLSGGFS